MFKKTVKKKSSNSALPISNSKVTESKKGVIKKISSKTAVDSKKDSPNDRNTSPEGNKLVNTHSLSTPRKSVRNNLEKTKKIAVEEKNKSVKHKSLSTPRRRNTSALSSKIYKSRSTSQLCHTPTSTRIIDSVSNINKRQNTRKNYKSMPKLTSSTKKTKPSVSDQTKKSANSKHKSVGNGLTANIFKDKFQGDDQPKNNITEPPNKRLSPKKSKDDQYLNKNQTNTKFNGSQNVLRNRRKLKNSSAELDFIPASNETSNEDVIFVTENGISKTNVTGVQHKNLSELQKNVLNNVEFKDVNENFNLNKNFTGIQFNATKKESKRREKTITDLSFDNNEASTEDVIFVDENIACKSVISVTDNTEAQKNVSDFTKVDTKKEYHHLNAYEGLKIAIKSPLKKPKKSRTASGEPDLSIINNKTTIEDIIFFDENISCGNTIPKINVNVDQSNSLSEVSNSIESKHGSDHLKAAFIDLNNQCLTITAKIPLKSEELKTANAETDYSLINNETSIEDLIFVGDNIACKNVSKTDVIGVFLNDKKQERSIHEQECNEPIVNSNVYCTVAKLDTDLDDVEFTGHIQLINENQNFTDFVSVAKSSSPISNDSAKGSSIANDEHCLPYKSGDLLWAQIYNYCYWPCIACPDPDGNIITNISSKNFVHVMFLADNCRTNMAKNVMPYAGLKSYKKLVDDIEKTEGKKAIQNKCMIPNRNREQKWYEAVREATILTRVDHSERLEVLKEMYENTRLISKTKMKRRLTMMETYDGDSQIRRDSIDDMSTEMVPLSKRQRSISPFSPQYSPIKAMPKRTKLSLGAELSKEEPSDTWNSTNSLCPDIFEDPNFKKLQLALKEFTTESNMNDKHDESLLIYAKKIWSLKYMNKVEYEQQLYNSYSASEYGSVLTDIENDGSSSSVKRLSNRLKHIAFQRLSTNLNQMNTKPVNELVERVQEERVKREPTRAIEEVIDDLYNLDQKYLFRGVGKFTVCKYCYKGGDNIIKCANCRSWIHVDCATNTRKNNDDSNVRRSITRRRSRSNSTTDSSLNIIASSINKNVNTQNNLAVSSQDAVNDLNTASNDYHLIDSDVLIQSNHEQTANKNQICFECAQNPAPRCYVCKNSKLLDSDEETLICHVQQCLQAYHPSCCRYWPQAKILKSNGVIQSFRCPSHVCHTCVSDDPRGKYQHLTKIIKCIRCPSSYHVNSHCIPAGSQILSSSYMICPRHDISKADAKINVNFCFICVGAGNLVCCETCPIAVHPECANIELNTKEPYICEECESGRLPLYGEMVWAKFNNFRWWPAVILAPTEIPMNIKKKPHNPLDFVIRFFGTHDHCWISRRRIYLYMEGDDTAPIKGKKEMDKNYERGVKEAKRIFEILNLKRMSLLNKGTNKLDPQPYEKIRSNRLVPPVKVQRNLEDILVCGCTPDMPHPCSPEANCINRSLYNECLPKLCPAGDRCENRCLQSKIYPKLEVIHTKNRGFGLICLEPISFGSFIIEYVGEIINEDEFKARLSQKANDFDDNFYYLSLEKDRIIDAGPKGNLARFINHSCQPNCEAQKWSINGITRIGLFALVDILPKTELTFNYSWNRVLGSGSKTCFCGAPKCAGQIGSKYMEDKTKVPDDDQLSQAKVTTKPKGRPRSIKTNEIKVNSAKRSDKKN
ncbi:probable histone-lysine N-methyltransferase Mes-4 [Teleopsis dalmanni]|uniref:probable histone-lysine N-methyltransferase Mes-4 n=1 Tax=Teleopsis dalmanni TaxID=139649 RepID=UPI0018CCB61C|nr:probable histone-lysine N-methyltransferase Mes-4 [Teleopsis dalmanni]